VSDIAVAAGRGAWRAARRGDAVAARGAHRISHPVSLRSMIVTKSNDRDYVTAMRQLEDVPIGETFSQATVFLNLVADGSSLSRT
jgi:phosphohistidine swiveling domain-containing protein